MDEGSLRDIAREARIAARATAGASGEVVSERVELVPTATARLLAADAERERLIAERVSKPKKKAIKVALPPKKEQTEASQDDDDDANVPDWFQAELDQAETSLDRSKLRVGRTNA